jgi:hypothetical protein
MSTPQARFFLFPYRSSEHLLETPLYEPVTSNDDEDVGEQEQDRDGCPQAASSGN